MSSRCGVASTELQVDTSLRGAAPLRLRARADGRCPDPAALTPLKDMWDSPYVSVPAASASRPVGAAEGAGSELEERALKCFARGELEEATQLLQEASTQTARRFVLLGEARRLSGEPDRALEEFRLALAAPGAAAVTGPAHYSRGLCFMSLGEWYAAAESFMQSAPGAELPAEALVSIGTCSRRLGDMERALQFFSRALELEPELTHARMCRAELLEALGEEASAADDYRQLLQHDPNFSAVYLREAYIAVASGLVQESATVCDGMLRLLAHAPESAPDYAYIEAQRSQFLALLQQSLEQQQRHAGATTAQNDGSSMVSPPLAAS